MKRAILAAAVALASLVSGVTSARADLTEWERSESPIFRGQYWASDPTVVREADGGYRMVYTCLTWPDPVFDEAEARAAICAATSDDGIAWENVPVEGPFEGVVFTGREDAWDQDIEGAFLLSWKGSTCSTPRATGTRATPPAASRRRWKWRARPTG